MDLWASDGSLSVSNSSIDVEDKFNQSDLGRQNSLLYTSGAYENENFSSFSNINEITGFHQTIPVHEVAKEQQQKQNHQEGNTASSDGRYTISLGEPLVVCHLWNRGLTTLPSQLFQMSQWHYYDLCLFQIEWLNISNNRLTQLPPELLSSLVSLKYLYASNNQIASISMDIRFLHHLKELSLDHNHITSLPRELFWCTNITHLYLPHNQLYWIPKDIVCLSKLKVLSISYNNLVALPAEIAKLPLEQLHIKSNPFLDQFLETIAPSTPTNTSEVLQYLAQAVPSSEKSQQREDDSSSGEESSDDEDEDELLEWLKLLQLEDSHPLLKSVVDTLEDLHNLQDVQLDFLDPEKKSKLLQAIYRTNMHANTNRHANQCM